MMEINFDKLLKDYDSNLLTKLRGFNKEFDYIKYWVPGSDKFKSLLNLIDAMHETKIYDFTINVSKSDKSLADKISKLAGGIGSILVIEKKNNLKIKININKLKYKFIKQKNKKILSSKNIKKTEIIYELNNKKQKYDILPGYEVNLQTKKLKYVTKNNLALDKLSQNLFSEIIDGNNKLYTVIEKQTKKIIKCWHDYKNISSKSILVDKFCDNIINKHIQEAAEHGVIYLEYSIRNYNIEKKIPGIILPKKSGGFFQILNQCINKIYKNCKIKYNFFDEINKHYFNPTNKWLSMPKEEKVRTIKKILQEVIIPKLKLNQKDIELDKLEFDTRVVLRISSDLKKKTLNISNYLIKIENLIKNLVDRRLELFTIELKDQNKLRLANLPSKEA